VWRRQGKAEQVIAKANNKTKKGNMIKGYKGFGKDWTCHGHKFEVGKTYTHKSEIKLCESGFHFCENPLDVLRYYSPTDSNFAEVEANNVSDEKSNDTKRVCSEIKIGAKITLSAVIQAGVSFLVSTCKNKSATSGNYSHSATSGDYSPSATSGDYSPSATSGDFRHGATSGDYSHSATSGNYSHSATSGYSSPSATSGDYSHSATSGNSSHGATSGDYSHGATTGYSSPSATSGNYSHSATSGDYSHSATSGNYSPSATSGDYSPSETKGKNSIASAIGKNSKAKSTLGNWIVLSEIDDNYNVLCVKTAKVDGKKIKADTWYKLKGGKFVATE
ncbi:MAG: hypothetical protein WCA81_19085, partial [Rhizomicrobium sp.]